MPIFIPIPKLEWESLAAARERQDIFIATRLNAVRLTITDVTDSPIMRMIVDGLKFAYSGTKVGGRLINRLFLAALGISFDRRSGNR